MKKTVITVLIIVLSGIFSCKGDSDVLVTYKDGEINRGEFYRWIDSKHFSKESMLKNQKRQKEKLKDMMFEKIAVQKAKEEGFDKSEEFKEFKDRATERQLIKRLYDKEITEKMSFKEPVVKVRQILLRVKAFKIDPAKKNKRVKLEKSELENEFGKAIDKAKTIIEKLDKGEKFEELAKIHSDDFSKRNGGDIGYIVRDMMPPEYSSVAFSLKESEYTKEPVRTSRGVYIIKAEDKDELNQNNIEKIIKDKTQAMRLKNRIYRRNASNYIDMLMNAKDVEKHFDKVTSRNKKDIIFKIGDKTYTVADLEKNINQRNKGPKGSRKSTPKITDDHKKNLAKNFFKYEILKRDAYNKGIHKDPEYIKETTLATDSILAREYMKKIFESNITVTKDEMLKEYNDNKQKRYYKMVTKKKKRVKVVEPFRKVKDRIEKILISRKKSEKRKQWKKDILKDYQFKILESELEGE